LHGQAKLQRDGNGHNEIKLLPRNDNWCQSIIMSLSSSDMFSTRFLQTLYRALCSLLSWCVGSTYIWCDVVPSC
jgi:hypothetical protein